MDDCKQVDEDDVSDGVKGGGSERAEYGWGQ